MQGQEISAVLEEEAPPNSYVIHATVYPINTNAPSIEGAVYSVAENGEKQLLAMFDLPPIEKSPETASSGD